MKEGHTFRLLISTCTDLRSFRPLAIPYVSDSTLVLLTSPRISPLSAPLRCGKIRDQLNQLRTNDVEHIVERE